MLSDVWSLKLKTKTAKTPAANKHRANRKRRRAKKCTNTNDFNVHFKCTKNTFLAK